MTPEQQKKALDLEKACISSAKFSSWEKRRGLTITKDELLKELCLALNIKAIDIKALSLGDIKTLIGTVTTIETVPIVTVPSSRYRDPYLEYLRPLIPGVKLELLPVASLKLLMEKLIDKARND